MDLLSKSVTWSSIVELGVTLCDHCRGAEGRPFKEAFTLGQRCPMNAASFGDRLAGRAGHEVDASTFAWLEAKKECDAADARTENEMALLKGYEVPFSREEIDGFLHTISAYAEEDVDYMMWQSATSGARIACYRKSRRSSTGKCLEHYWTAELHDGHKPSWYASLWESMA
jgi:hypothetical protein